ncbi:LysR family transcriptional regulator [Niallia circulans]|uniref:LysR family transcriptional regulator n=1 Tax=Shouchella clausii TaxID=79880 RepID=UPI000B971407|nr:LysR family transcriptional regulator [Shouchella clausii]PAD41588.1 LysR family transcriptional regulator [Bacillus sp. 7520-S]SPU21015.1 LysR family transcriptional regulator [Niallia circulans]AST96531.1 LysR family transcriptional regulator [Shouchella clausii]MBU8596299.1 LysR family transcriptional regulator [Shouchella clausii]MCR1289545.1 LysR family transcriptional regulator [Shouchella clausii]
MNIQKLDVFLTLVETKKMTETAQQLKLSAPTVSFHIRSLEKEYGIKLFRTNAGGYRLTPGGEILYHYAKQLSQTNQKLEHALFQFKKGEAGSLQLGASGVPAQLFMPELIHKMAERYPRINVSLDVKTAPEIEQKLVRQELDFGLIMETSSQAKELVYEAFACDELVLAYSKDHPFSKVETTAEVDLSKQRLLVHTLSSSTKHFSKTWLKGRDEEMDLIELDSVSTIIKMLSFGQAVALISKRLIENEDHLAFTELDDNRLKRQIYFVYHQHLWENDAILFFKESVAALKEVITIESAPQIT